MAGGAMNNPIRIITAAALLALAGCGGGGSGKQAAEPPLAGARIGGPFTLVNQDGRTVTERDYDGRYRLIYFGYTFCPDVCPNTLQKLMKAFQSFASKAPDRAAKVQPIFITIDPARDTPAVMKQYVNAFDPRLVGLTGTPAQVAAVSKEFAVFSQKVESKGSSDYLMDHSSVPMLFGPKGEPIALLTTSDQSSDQLAAELDKWVT
jgi:protein SCO1/2